MKLLISSDWHLDWTTAGVRRTDDLRDAVQETVERAIHERVDAYMFLGDLCNPDSGSRVFECLCIALGAAQALAKEGIESHWIAGNHDVIEDGAGFTTISPLKRLGGAVYVHENPSVVVLGDMKANLLVLPYVPFARDYNAAEYVERKFKTLSRAQPLVVAGHLMVPGIIPGVETSEMPRGRDMAFPLDTIKAFGGCDVLMLNGHYHKQQEFDGVHIPGSLERLTFGEESHSPGYLLVEV